MTDHSALRSATVEEMREARGFYAQWARQEPAPFASLAAAALSLIAEGRQSGAFEVAAEKARGRVRDRALFRTLAGGDW